MNDEGIITHETAPVELDLRYQHRRIQQGDITVMLTWNWADDQPVAVMVLAPTYWDKSHGTPTLCVIPRAEAWRWSRTHNNDRHMLGYHGFGNPPSSDAWQAAMAVYYAELLGLNGADTRVQNRIRGIIEDYLDELLSIPPAPKREGMGQAVFEVTDLNTGKTNEVIIEER